MTYKATLTALAVLTALTTGAAIAGAEVPQSRVAPPRELRVDPTHYTQQERAAADEAALKAALPTWRKTEEGRSARRSKIAGMVLLSVSSLALPMGGIWMYSASNPTSGMSGQVGLVGAGCLAVGGLSLLIGLPMFIDGVKAKPSVAAPSIQVGSQAASLAWSF